MKKIIWGNTIVKNEDRYIWFAIKSVIDYLDKLIIYDTGSTDKTVEIIMLLKSQYPEKILFEQKGNVDPKGLTKLRQEMLEITKSDWFILVDGDEVWWKNSIQEVVARIGQDEEELYALVNSVINLVGDIFHYQEEAAGQYQILGKKGHFNIRALNRKIPGLHVASNYPLEGFYDGEKKLIQNIDEKLEFVNSPILHFSFLKRSSVEDSKNTLNRGKIKSEIGQSFSSDFQYPEALYLKYPKIVLNPFQKMDIKYRIKAAIATPFKKIRRRLK